MQTEEPLRPLRVLLGVSGGIAAYKAAEVVRQLRGRGHQVRCALTRSATAFVAPLTLEVLSGERVYQEDYLQGDGSGEELHITAAEWADVLLVAPATAHTLGRLSLGLADDFLSTTALAFEGPVVVAPAMHRAMWEHRAVLDNVSRLRGRGVVVVGPEVGPLASGEVAIGRMSEPADVVRAVEEAVAPGLLSGRRVLVSAGPTREAIDPVRFLSNRSSGKMGFAIAAAAARLGAETTLVAGPVALATPPGVERVDVTTAEEMRTAVQTVAPHVDVVAMVAAVSDFRPSAPSPGKLKKHDSPLAGLEWEPTVDILGTLRELAPQAVLVGFAAETDDVLAHARRKLERKDLDFIVANDVGRSDVGFATDDNEITVLARDGREERFAKQDKRLLAEGLLQVVATALKARETKPA